MKQIYKLSFIFLLFYFCSSSKAQGLSLVIPQNNLVLNDSVASFQWSTYYSYTNYEIQVDTMNDFSTPSISLSGLSLTYLNNQNLLWGRKYYWRVRAYTGGTYSPWSNINTFIVFKPTLIPSIAAWFIASSRVTLTAGVISSWQSNAPDLTNLTQSTTSRRPILTSNFANGKPAVYFNGTLHFLSTGDFLDIRTNDFTYVALHAPLNPDNYTVFSKSTMTSSVSNRYGLLKNGGNWQYLYHGTSDTSSLTSYAVNNNVLMQSEVINRATSLKKEYVNDSLITTGWCNSSAYDFNSGLSFSIGATNFLYFYKGYIPEIILFRQALNDSLLHLTHQYLSDRYYPPVNIGPDTFLNSFCSSPIVLKADTAYTSFLWSTGSTSASITVSTLGKYWVRVTNKLGFVSTDTISILPSGANSLSSLYGLCLNDTLRLDAGFSPSTHSYLWSNGDTNKVAKFYAPGSYSIRVSERSSGCTFTYDTISISVDSFSMHISLGNDTFLSTGAAITLQSGLSLVDSFFWFNGSTNSSVYADRTANYSVRVKNTNNCEARDTVHITLNTVSICGGGVSLVKPSIDEILNDSIVNFRWSPYFDDTSFEIEVDTNADFSANSIRLTGLSATILNNQTLAWGKTYYWRVRSFNGFIYSEWSSIRAFTIFRPKDFSNLAGWFDASKNVTLTSGVVSNWQSSGDDATDINQATSSRRPALNPSFANGKASLYFNGTINFLTGGDVFDIRTNSFTYITLHAPEFPDNYAVMAKSTNGIVNNRYGLFKTGGLWNYQYYSTDDSSTYNSFLVNNNVLLQSQTINRSTREKNSYVNDTLVQTDYCSPASYDFNSGLSFTVGAVNFLSFYKGNIPEIILYRQALDNASLHLVHKYLSDKYYPPVNLGPDTFVNSLCPVPILLKADTSFTSYLWSNGSTSSSIIVSSIGNYWVKVTNKLGFISTDTICVIPMGINRITPILNNYKICQGDSVSIDVGFSSITHAFLWNTGETTSNRNIVNSGHYTVRITEIATGCEINLDTIVFEVDSFKSYFNVGSDTSICTGNSIGVQSDRLNINNILWNTSDTTFDITISSAGSYIATAINNFGCVAIDSINVTIKGNAPNVDFLTTNNCFNDTMRTINLSTTLLPDRLRSYRWFFGDGDSTAGFQPRHYYDSVGTYSIRLFAISDSGCTNNFSRTISITTIPDANIASSIICAQSNALISDASISQPGDIVNVWHWNINGDTFATQNVYYDFPSAGKYFISLRVTSGVNLCSDYVQDSFEVFPAINPDFSSNNICLGDTTKFADITPSFSIIQREWNINTGALYAFTIGTKYVFPSAGAYLVSLKVKNAIGCEDSVGKYIRIYDLPNAFFADSVACLNSIKSFTDLSTSIGDSIDSWNWLIDTSNYVTQNVNHIANNNSNFLASLTVSTVHGCTNSFIRNIVVASPPIADFTYTPSYGIAPITIYFTNTSINASNYVWYFDDVLNTTSTVVSPNFDYDTDGDYTITLIATSAQGCSDSVLKLLNINPTNLDLLVDELEVTQNTSSSGAVEIKSMVRLSNMGSRNITTADLLARLDNGSTLLEKWNGLITPGQRIFYTFNTSFYSTNIALNKYICVEAVNVNDGTEINLANNLVCANLNTQGVVSLVYPNPANQNAKLDIILVEATIVNISIINELGEIVVAAKDYEATGGLNTFNINTNILLDGQYFIKVKYFTNEEMRKLQISR